MSEIRVRVKRTSGIEEEFTVNAGEYTTVLDALEAVRSSQDESLLYRHSRPSSR